MVFDKNSLMKRSTFIAASILELRRALHSILTSERFFSLTAQFLKFSLETNVWLCDYRNFRYILCSFTAKILALPAGSL